MQLTMSSTHGFISIAYLRPHIIASCCLTLICIMQEPSSIHCSPYSISIEIQTDSTSNVQVKQQTNSTSMTTTQRPKHPTRDGKIVSIQDLMKDFEHMFSEHSANYPEQKIRLALDKTPDDIKQLFNVINTPLDSNMNISERVANRYDESEIEVNEEPVCRAIMRLVYPKEVKKDKSTLYIANTEEFTQALQVEICQDANDGCKYVRDGLPLNYESACRQKYSFKRLLYFNPDENRMSNDVFRYPSCCSCHVYRNDNARSISSNSDKISGISVDDIAQKKAHYVKSPQFNNDDNNNSDRFISIGVEGLDSSTSPRPLRSTTMADETILLQADSPQTITNLRSPKRQAKASNLIQIGSPTDQIELATYQTTPVSVNLSQAHSTLRHPPRNNAPKPMGLLQNQDNVARDNTTTSSTRPPKRQPPKSTSTPNNAPRPTPTNSQSSTIRQPKQTNNTSSNITDQTVVLHDDKVYMPSNT